MSSYGWGQFGRAIITGATRLFIVSLMTTLVVVGLISGGFALWQHSSYPLMWGLVAIIPTYLVFFFAYYYYLKHGL